MIFLDYYNKLFLFDLLDFQIIENNLQLIILLDQKIHQLIQNIYMIRHKK